MDELDLKLGALRAATEDLGPSPEALSAMHSAIDAVVIESALTSQAPQPLPKPAPSKLLHMLFSTSLTLLVTGALLFAIMPANQPMTLQNVKNRVSQLTGVQPVVSAVVVINGKEIPCEPTAARVNRAIAEEMRDGGRLKNADFVEKAKVTDLAADGTKLPSCESLLRKK